jgi:hypothetical protein
VVDGRLETEGPQPLAGPLPASIKARRDELVAYLLECCGGTWPAAPGSKAYTPPKPPQSERIAEVLAQIRRGRVA